MDDLLTRMLAIDKQGNAVVEEAERRGFAAEEVTDFRVLPGNGLEARRAGRLLQGGSGAYIRTLTAVPEDLAREADALSGQGKTPLFFAEDGRLLGCIAVADVIKADSAEAIRQLRQAGVRVVMLTGDNERTAKAIGEQAGVDEVIAGVLPDGKEAVIRRLQETGRVAMVGDGINDAPALTRADMGIAIGAGTDVAIDAADVVLMKSRLSDVPAAIRLSRATLRNIHQNLFWAFIYNVIGIPLAAGVFIPIFGWTLNPMFGAAAMSLSSFCVVSNALRLNFVRLKGKAGGQTPPPAPEIRTVSAAPSPRVRMELTIDGMMCEHCEARVKKALESIPGVISAKADHQAGKAFVQAEQVIDEALLRQAVETEDYQVTGILSL